MDAVGTCSIRDRVVALLVFRAAICRFRRLRGFDFDFVAEDGVASTSGFDETGPVCKLPLEGPAWRSFEVFSTQTSVAPWSEQRVEDFNCAVFALLQPN